MYLEVITRNINAFGTKKLDKAVKERKKSRKTIELQNIAKNRTTYNTLTARVRYSQELVRENIAEKLAKILT